MAPPWVKENQDGVATVNVPPWTKNPPPSKAMATSSHLPSNAFPPALIQVSKTSGPHKQTFAASNAQNSSTAPKSLGALLQQVPLPSPSYESCQSAVVPEGGPSKPLPLKTLIAPVPAGPLAGAKFVLPPVPPRPPPKVVGGTNRTKLLKIATLRQAVREHPSDISGLLREIERGAKLMHVPCLDRSKPLVGPVQTFFPDF